MIGVVSVNPTRNACMQQSLTHPSKISLDNFPICQINRPYYNCKVELSNNNKASKTINTRVVKEDEQSFVYKMLQWPVQNRGSDGEVQLLAFTW